jgi:hypothetical protein
MWRLLSGASLDDVGETSQGLGHRFAGFVPAQHEEQSARPQGLV